MQLTALFVGVGINLIVIALVYVHLNRKIGKRNTPGSIISDVRREVDEMIVELNQTTDRNIGIIEERIQRISKAVDEADQRIRLLQKNTDTFTMSTATYSNVRPKVRQQKAEDTQASTQTQRKNDSAGRSEEQGNQAPVRNAHTAAGGSGTSSAVHGSSKETAAGSGPRSGPRSAGRGGAYARGSSSTITGELDFGPASNPHDQSGDNGESGTTGESREQLNGRDGTSERNAADGQIRGNGQSGIDNPGRRSSSEDTDYDEQSAPSTGDLRPQVRALYLQGMSAEVIASRLGGTVGEVELMITLMEEKDR